MEVDWQPIEAAPRDGTKILVTLDTVPRSVTIAAWPEVGRQAWREHWKQGRILFADPIAWVPLPEPAPLGIA